eukprot:TRINITY_DN40777_c0_g1_i2.p1 TRINITY_DN40777_c0_g1~~TRINITY_DN40777_c0_g1_i2.p1  ORF type:complete len:292 (-),score=70.96 TRINITY_DN40777_c0_g1_i2:96-971(-)
MSTMASREPSMRRMQQPRGAFVLAQRVAQLQEALMQEVRYSKALQEEVDALREENEALREVARTAKLACASTLLSSSLQTCRSRLSDARVRDRPVAQPRAPAVTVTPTPSAQETKAVMPKLPLPPPSVELVELTTAASSLCASPRSPCASPRWERRKSMRSEVLSRELPTDSTGLQKLLGYSGLKAELQQRGMKDTGSAEVLAGRLAEFLAHARRPVLQRTLSGLPLEPAALEALLGRKGLQEELQDRGIKDSGTTTQLAKRLSTAVSLELLEPPIDCAPPGGGVDAGTCR